MVFVELFIVGSVIICLIWNSLCLLKIIYQNFILLLFFIYINDVCNIDADCNVKLYADDTNVFVHDRCLEDVFCKAT